MTWNMRPLSVTILAWVYIGVGTIGFVSHFTEIHGLKCGRSNLPRRENRFMISLAREKAFLDWCHENQARVLFVLFALMEELHGYD